MTTSSSATYTPQQIAHLQSYLNLARTEAGQGDLDAAQQALAGYYQAQMPGGTLGVDRGYAGLANGVVTGSGVAGRTALDVLDDVGGSAVTPALKTNLMQDLAQADLDTIKNNGGGWPTMGQIEDYHYNAYDQNHLPVDAWGGAALAHDGKRWDGGALTDAELGDGSHGALYQSLPADQVCRNASSVLKNGAAESALSFTLPSQADTMAAAADDGGSSGTDDASSQTDDTERDAGTDTTGQNLAGASPYDPTTLTDQDVAELTPDFASWSTLMNGGAGADLQDS